MLMLQRTRAKPIKQALAAGLALFFAATTHSLNISCDKCYPNQEATFTTTFSNSNGYSEFRYARLLIKANSSASSFFGHYDTAANRLSLLNDITAKWLGAVTPGARNSSGREIILENSYCRLNCTKTSVTKQGNSLVIKWVISFKPSFLGVKQCFVYAGFRTGGATGTVYKREFCVIRQPIGPPKEIR